MNLVTQQLKFFLMMWMEKIFQNKMYCIFFFFICWLCCLFALKASSPKRTKLEAAERDDVLSPLKKSGWTMVEGRDAIYKEFLFKDFNEVFVHFFLQLLGLYILYCWNCMIFYFICILLIFLQCTGHHHASWQIKVFAWIVWWISIIRYQ